MSESMPMRLLVVLSVLLAVGLVPANASIPASQPQMGLETRVGVSSFFDSPTLRGETPVSPEFALGWKPSPVWGRGGKRSLHLYYYALNNPLRYVDPDGHAGIELDYRVQEGGSEGRINPLPYMDDVPDFPGRGALDLATGFAVQVPLVIPAAIVGTVDAAINYEETAHRISEFARHPIQGLRDAGQAFIDADNVDKGRFLANVVVPTPLVAKGLGKLVPTRVADVLRKGAAVVVKEGQSALKATGELAKSVTVRETGAVGRLSRRGRQRQATRGAAEFQVELKGKASELSRLDRKGFLEFRGLEVRGARDLSHLDESTLRAMSEKGFAAKDVKGDPLVLHHLEQNPAGPVVEIPSPSHRISNRIQHPDGNKLGAGLTPEQRAGFDLWRVDYWKARAREELNRRTSK